MGYLVIPRLLSFSHGQASRRDDITITSCNREQALHTVNGWLHWLLNFTQAKLSSPELTNLYADSQRAPNPLLVSRFNFEAEHVSDDMAKLLVSHLLESRVPQASGLRPIWVDTEQQEIWIFNVVQYNEKRSAIGFVDDSLHHKVAFLEQWAQACFDAKEERKEWEGKRVSLDMDAIPSLNEVIATGLGKHAVYHGYILCKIDVGDVLGDMEDHD